MKRAEHARAFFCGSIALLCMMLTSATAGDDGPAVRVEVGHPFPTLALPLLEDGSPASIADFRGQKIIMHIFASW